MFSFMRFSVEKAEHNYEREDAYMDKCIEIARNRGIKLELNHGAVLVDEKPVSRGKRKWYRAWLFITESPIVNPKK